MTGKNGLKLHADDLRALGVDVVESLSKLDPKKADELRHNYRFWARPEQIPKEEGDWNVFLALAGRGWGKTWAGAQWCREQVKRGKKRLIAVAATNSDIERVMVKGESGFLSVCWKGDKTYSGQEMGYPEWSPTKRTLTWANGANVTFFSAEEPERLRGPQGDGAWCFISGTLVETEHGLVPVESVKKGMRVLTREGYKPVVATSSREAVVGTVSFSNGQSLTGTREHPIYTDRGWVNLGKLCIGDKVCAIPVLNGAESGGIDIPVATTSTVEPAPLKEKTEVGFIERSTKRLLERFQLATTFITKMATRLTTNPPTWNYCPHQNTLKDTIERGQTYLRTGQKSPNKVGSVVTADFRSFVSSCQKWFAKAALIKEQKTREKQKEFAGSVGQVSSLVLGTSVASVASTWVERGRDIVYNVQVLEKPEYFANGILTHNCDELCAWSRDRDTWNMLQFCLRLGKHPRVFITTTPKPTKLIREILKHPKTLTVRGSTFDNKDNLAETYIAAVKDQYEGTRLGRQELHAEILDEASGALWTRDTLAKAEFETELDPVEFAKTLARVVVSVDPQITTNEESDMTGIVVAGIDVNGVCYVLEDATDRFTPEGWASKAIELYHKYQADRLVAERNQGGEMVRHTFKTVDETLPIKLVHASRGKFARAEPVSSLYERGRVKHFKGLDALEDQMVQWEPLGSIGSPDRLDAMVWAITELALKGVSRPELSLSYSDNKGSLSLST